MYLHYLTQPRCKQRHTVPSQKNEIIMGAQSFAVQIHQVNITPINDSTQIYFPGCNACVGVISHTDSIQLADNGLVT